MNIGESSRHIYYKIWYKGDGQGRWSGYTTTYDLDAKFSSIADAEKNLEAMSSFLVNKEEKTWRKRTMAEKKEIFEIHEIKEEVTRVR